MTKSNLKALSAYFRAKSLIYFQLRNEILLIPIKLPKVAGNRQAINGLSILLNIMG